MRPVDDGREADFRCHSIEAGPEVIGLGIQRIDRAVMAL